MKAIHVALRLAALTAGSLAIGAILPAPAAAGLPVFDAANYAQNLLEAARALDQINNQLRSLQNETAMLQAMAKNLKTIDFPQLERMTSAMQRIDGLMGRAQAIQFKVQGLDRQIDTLFPGADRQALTGDQRLAEARARLDAATAAYRQAMTVQAQVAENVQEDSGLLSALAEGSQDSVGALQVQQAGNQLLALSVKQQLQLQTLLGAEFRDSAIERARRAQAEADGRATTRRFLSGIPARN